MRAKAIAAVLALGALALFVAPAGASANPGFYKRPGVTASLVSFQAPGGYDVSIFVVGAQALVIADHFGFDGPGPP